MCDACPGVGRQLGHPVETGRRRREDLANPVRRHSRRALQERNEPLLPPARQVWNEKVLSEVNHWLRQDDPATGPTNSAPERTDEIRREVGGHEHMGYVRPRQDDELAVDDMADDVLRQVVEILQRSGLARGCEGGRHGLSVTQPALGGKSSSLRVYGGVSWHDS